MLSSFSRCFKTGFKDLSGRLSKPLTEFLDPDPISFSRIQIDHGV